MRAGALRRGWLLILASFTFASAPAHAGEVSVAVAANFAEAAREIAAAFASETGHEAVLSFGSTGQLFAQMTQGAPFEVLLAADAERPARAVAEGHGVADTVFTYAVGHLVLWSAEPALVTGPETLQTGRFGRLAVANAETAPYGAAAVEVIAALGLSEALLPKIVQGNSIAQTHQFVATGNAELGFVARSQLAAGDAGSRWEVPAHLHRPIRQEAVLLKPGLDNEAAAAFLEFLRGAAAAAVIERHGYTTGADR